MDTEHAIKSLLAKPSVDALIYALRHPETWPEGFEWDYSYCMTCAMGLSMYRWEEIEGPDWYSVGSAIKMPDTDARGIFLHLALATTDAAYRPITPERVADELEAWQAGKERAL